MPLTYRTAFFILSPAKSEERNLMRLSDGCITYVATMVTFSAVIPSRDVVIVRMGVTHDISSWPQEEFIRQVLDSILKR